MATNNFIDFANTDTGTNLLTQAQYLAASDRTNGNQPGVASSKLVNKALRQSSFIIANIAQYISDKLNSSVLDDGVDANILAQINSAFAPNDSFSIENLTIAATVGASALTVSVKTQAAGNPSATDVVYVGMRSATLGSGIYNRRSISGSLSMVVSSGSTLGQSNGVAGLIYVYLIDNAGTLELAVSQSFYPENGLVTTTAEGGVGGADSATLIYSTTARSSVPIRLIGTLTNTQATAGTWATNPSQIQLLPCQQMSGLSPTIQIFTSGTGTYTKPFGVSYIKVKMVGGGGGGAGSGTSPGATGAGGNTTFGSTVVVANGGTGGTGTSTAAPGGSASLGTGAVGQTLTGGTGQSGGGNTSSSGGTGGSNPFGGFGQAGTPSQNGVAAIANTGGGGGGAGDGATAAVGAGGGAGGYADAIISNPSATYAYAVGIAGTAGTAGTGGFAGGAGGSGVIIIEEHYK